MVEAVVSVVDAAALRRLDGGHLERLVRFCGRSESKWRLDFRRGSGDGLAVTQTRLLDGYFDVIQFLE